MRKLLLLAAVGALVLAVAVPALAAAGVKLSLAPRTAATRAVGFELNGKVARVFTTAGAIKVSVRMGTAGVRPFIGRALTMRVGGRAVLLSVDEGIAHAVTLRQLKVGDQVHVTGRVDVAGAAPVYVASRVQVRHWTPAAQLDEFGCGGVVTAVDASGVHLTVKSASRALWASLGADVTVAVPDGARLFTWAGGAKTAITLADVSVGSSVWTRGTVDRTQATPAYNADVLVLRQAPTAQL